VIKKTVLLILITCISVGAVHLARADRLIIKYQNGEKQIVELKNSVNDIWEFKFIKEKRSKNVNYHNRSEHSKKSQTEQMESKKNPKKSQNFVDFGNGIKGEWETPNPYLPPANE